VEYPVNVAAGTYSVLATVATPSSGHTIVGEIRCVALTTVVIPNTGGYGNFQTVTVPNIAFSGGIIKYCGLKITGGDYNIDKVEVKKYKQPYRLQAFTVSQPRLRLRWAHTPVNRYRCPANATNKKCYMVQQQHRHAT